MGKLITVAEAAARLNLSKPTVYGMIDEGRLPGFRFGRSVRVDEDELEAWKEAQRVPASPPAIEKRPPGRPRGRTETKRDPRWRDMPDSMIYTGLACLTRSRQ